MVVRCHRQTSDSGGKGKEKKTDRKKEKRKERADQDDPEKGTKEAKKISRERKHIYRRCAVQKTQAKGPEGLSTAPLGGCHLPLWHTGKPVDKHRAEDIGRDVHPHQTKVAPSISEIATDLQQERICFAN